MRRALCAACQDSVDGGCQNSLHPHWLEWELTGPKAKLTVVEQREAAFCNSPTAQRIGPANPFECVFHVLPNPLDCVPWIACCLCLCLRRELGTCLPAPCTCAKSGSPTPLPTPSRPELYRLTQGSIPSHRLVSSTVLLLLSIDNPNCNCIIQSLTKKLVCCRFRRRRLLHF